MTATVTVTVASLRSGNAARALGPVHLADLADVLAALLLGRQVDAFAAEGHHLRGGDPWEPRSEPYGSRMTRIGFTKTLTISGRLRASTRAEGAADADGITIALHADTPYARFHQHGTARMPARRVFEITEQDREFVRATAERFIETALSAEGGT